MLPVYLVHSRPSIHFSGSFFLHGHFECNACPVVSILVQISRFLSNPPRLCCNLWRKFSYKCYVELEFPSYYPRFCLSNALPSIEGKIQRNGGSERISLTANYRDELQFYSLPNKNNKKRKKQNYARCDLSASCGLIFIRIAVYLR